MATLLGAAWQAGKEQDFSLFNPRTKLAGLGCREQDDGFPANNKAAVQQISIRYRRANVVIFLKRDD